jgi:hypothetical protein
MLIQLHKQATTTPKIRSIGHADCGPSSWACRVSAVRDKVTTRGQVGNACSPSEIEVRAKSQKTLRWAF